MSGSSSSAPPRHRTSSSGQPEIYEHQYDTYSNHTPYPPSNGRSTSSYPLSGSPTSAYPPSPPRWWSIHSIIASPRYLIRPSIRLKTSLYTLVLIVFALSILALNAASLTRPQGGVEETILSKSPASGSPADSEAGGQEAQGKDAHLVEEEIQRSFEEPDFALLSGKQPYQIGCDVPLRGEGAGEAEGKLVFLGIFSTADRKARRDLYRRVVNPDFPTHLVTIKFIIGLPPFPEKPISGEAFDRSKVLKDLRSENSQHGDMVILPVVDNIDLGKTHEYFKWVAKEYAGEGPVKGRPRFVMKADDDTILVMPNVISAFKDLDCRRNVYWGTSAGRSHYFGDYFRGLAYAMSWPLVSWIGSAAMPPAHIIKIEDARTGQWLRHLDTVTDPVKRIDMGWTMGDYNQLDIGIETVGLHWLKMDDWVTEQHDNLLKIWAEADRPYTHEHGVAPRLSIAKGKLLPSAAQAEHERQKELGWDVQGNLD